MLSMSWTSPYEGEIETLKFKETPWPGQYHTDIDGNVWDVRAYRGDGKRPYINARLVDNSSYYSTTPDSNSNGFHKWKPFYFEIVK